MVNTQHSIGIRIFSVILSPLSMHMDLYLHFFCRKILVSTYNNLNPRILVAKVVKAKRTQVLP